MGVLPEKSFMKRDKIIFWVATTIIFLFEGVMPLFTINMPEAKTGIQHLGYPDYFRIALIVFKVLGAVTIVITGLPNRIREWAYAGFAFDFIFATISHTAVDGVGANSFSPLIFLAILAVSYVYYIKAYPQKQ